jgi:hypothetical protein
MMRHSIPWPLLIGLGWVVAFGASAVERFTPASKWLEVRSVQVENTIVGVAPVMHVDREIKQSFVARWSVNVDKLNALGRFVQDCSANGGSHYEPDKDLPNPLFLDWWTYPVHCAPTSVGKYRVDTVWTIELSGGLTKQVRAVSNTFVVSPGN